MDNYFADISSNNIGFEAGPYASAGHVAIAIKATEGTGFTNPEYAGESHNWVRDAHRHNLPVFHYHFCRPEHGEARQQAEHFWNITHPHFRRPGDYVVADVETGDPTQAAKWLVEFDSHLRNISGTHPILYTYLSFLSSARLTITSKQVWLAAYQSRRPSDGLWRLPRGLRMFAWQYTDGRGFGPRGAPQSFAGIPGHCDGSILNPTVAKTLRKQGRR